MLKSMINEFRKQNGRHSLDMNHFQEDEHCLQHCKYMADVHGCSHTSDFLLNGKSEALSYRSFFKDYREVLGSIIFEEFSGSMVHRNILLFSDNIACAFHVRHDINVVFVTVRGW